MSAQERRAFGEYAVSKADEQQQQAAGGLYSSPTAPPPAPSSHHHHRQYLQQPPIHNLSAYNSPTSPYASSYAMDRLSGVSTAPPPAQYSTTTSSSGGGGSGGAGTVGGSGYLDAFNSLPLPEVMALDMVDPLGGMDLSILEHRDFRMLDDRASSRSKGPDSTLRSSDAMEDGKGRGGGGGGGRRKRATSDDGSETDPSRGGRGSNRKQRGRPRLDTKDENAADRRRTQIRLAQRAYRLRKETTISSLRTRVQELENAIEGMQSTFLELHDAAMHCMQDNKQRELYGNNLKALTERFLALARGALGTSEAGDSMGEDDAAAESGSNNNNNNKMADSSSSGGERRRSKDDGGPSGGMPDQQAPSAYGGYQISYDRASSQGHGGYGGGSSGNGGGQTSTNSNSNSNSNGDSRSNRNSPHPSMELTALDSPRDPFANLMRPQTMGGFAANFSKVAGMTIPRELDTFSYSFHETSFSRRLHRASLERAFQLLTCPNADKYEVERMFAYTFRYANREDVIRSIAIRLQSAKHESLDSDQRRELRTTPRRPYDYQDQLDAFHGRPPRSDAELRERAELKTRAYQLMVSMGIRDNFLRPDDVEAILVEKGILTRTLSEDAAAGILAPGPGNSSSNGSYASLADLPTAGHVSPVSSTAGSSASSVSDAQEARTPEEWTNTTTTATNGSPTFRRLQSPADGFNQHYTYHQQQQQNQQQLHQLQIHQQLHQQDEFDTTLFGGRHHSEPAPVELVDDAFSELNHKVVQGVKRYVDLDLLVKELVSKGVCLGRFPGFKREDIDAALAVASSPVDMAY